MHDQANGQQNNAKPAKQAEPTTRKAGVADYFCVLGIGDTLTWKHAQQGQQQLCNEEAEIERFAREIINIVVCTANPSDLPLLPTSPSNGLTSFGSLGDREIAGNDSVDGLHQSLSQSKPLHLQPIQTNLHETPVSSYVNNSNYHSSNWVVLEQTMPALVEYGAKTWYQPYQRWTANLDWYTGLRSQVLPNVVIESDRDNQSDATKNDSVNLSSQHGLKNALPLSRLRRRVEDKIKQWKEPRSVDEDDSDVITDIDIPQTFYLAYQTRGSRDDKTKDIPAVADVKLGYVRVHRQTLVELKSYDKSEGTDQVNNNLKSPLPNNALGHLWNSRRFKSNARLPSPVTQSQDSPEQQAPLVALEDFLELPENFDEWSIPLEFAWIQSPGFLEERQKQQQLRGPVSPVATTQTVLWPASPNGGVEAMDAPITTRDDQPDSKLPTVYWNGVPSNDRVGVDGENSALLNNYFYIPVVALRRQRYGDEERYHEDAALVDVSVTFFDSTGDPVLPTQFRNDDSDDEEEEDDGEFRILGKSPWRLAANGDTNTDDVEEKRQIHHPANPAVVVRRNLPFGVADAAFDTRVLGRFPERNYKGLPLPEEELPMFCYPTGCRLYRAQYSDGPLPQYYGFVVKNERGDSIYVSCVSFFEPLTSYKCQQLAQLSRRRKHTSVPHRYYHSKSRRRIYSNDDSHELDLDYADEEYENNHLLTGFDEMTTYENKTICLVSRYPFWTAYRKFLSRLHNLSVSLSDLPLERYISHLLLTVPIPKAGGPSVLIPCPTLQDPLIMTLPHEKDFPLVDLPFERLVACLDIKTIVMIVLGMLALERKVIVMSTRPSLVLDVCELLRALLFPFDLCAPYVPRLTEPFKSSLEFPGAIFVGIHDDGTKHGLAANVRKEIPEDGIVVDLDHGEIDCDGDGATLIKTTWDMIPDTARTALVTELQTLCRDAQISDGKELQDKQFDSDFDISIPAVPHTVGNTYLSKEPLDDRAFRDAFLRFFCSVLGGYERHLVVPDADFLTSGSEWFDTKGFLASVSVEKAPYLTSLVSTQLFQSFVQRRTEASDVHCLLFDECLTEFHSTPIPYGRLGGDVEAVATSDSDHPQMLYSLLVDQASSAYSNNDTMSIVPNKSIDASEADSSFSIAKTVISLNEVTMKYSETVFNLSGDIVTIPSRQGLPDGKQYVYCIDGNPCFPHKFSTNLYLPSEPDSWLVQMPKEEKPLLARNDKELDEAERLRRKAITYRGLQSQRRCLWQLPKLMGSHFLGAWLMCIPARISQGDLSPEQQSRYLLQALGALKLLRSKQRIVPDEAAYRAIMMACGRTKSDRRVEVVKLFGLLRSDGIFPSAVTLGQYTRALAEGYSKRSSQMTTEDESNGVEVTESASRIGGRFSVVSLSQRSADYHNTVSGLDGMLAHLETNGKRWRYRSSSSNDRQGGSNDHDVDGGKTSLTHSSRPWLPVFMSSSFLPTTDSETTLDADVILTAIWSRTQSCSCCGYIPLEEEVQAGWDVVNENDIPGAVSCPRCGSPVIPMLGYRELSVEKSLREAAKVPRDYPNFLSTTIADFDDLPPQIGPTLLSSHDETQSIEFVAYISPSSLRCSLEQYVKDYGEEVLSRDRLKKVDPEVYYNLWWYCARFSLPLPLPIVPIEDGATTTHCCAFVAWDRKAAERGCYSAAKALAPYVLSPSEMSSIALSPHGESSPFDFDDSPLLSKYNLQGFYSSVWDHPDISKILTTLVEACEKRDFKAVIDSVIKCNQRRLEEYGSSCADTESDVGYSADVRGTSDTGSISLSPELDVYRTLLYLAKYQCTSAFHKFFPTVIKPCKGSHFWCASGTPLPIFDRLIREGMHRIQTSKDSSAVVPFHDVSDVALGFRCVFGHLI